MSVEKDIERLDWLISLKEVAAKDMEMVESWNIPAEILDAKGYPMETFWEDVEEIVDDDGDPDRYQQNKFFQEYMQGFINQVTTSMALDRRAKQENAAHFYGHLTKADGLVEDFGEEAQIELMYCEGLEPRDIVDAFDNYGVSISNIQYDDHNSGCEVRIVQGLKNDLLYYLQEEMNYDTDDINEAFPGLINRECFHGEHCRGTFRPG